VHCLLSQSSRRPEVQESATLPRRRAPVPRSSRRGWPLSRFLGCPQQTGAGAPRQGRPADREIASGSVAPSWSSLQHLSPCPTVWLRVQWLRVGMQGARPASYRRTQEIGVDLYTTPLDTRPTRGGAMLRCRCLMTNSHQCRSPIPSGAHDTFRAWVPCASHWSVHAAMDRSGTESPIIVADSDQGAWTTATRTRNHAIKYSSGAFFERVAQTRGSRGKCGVTVIAQNTCDVRAAACCSNYRGCHGLRTLVIFPCEWRLWNLDGTQKKYTNDSFLGKRQRGEGPRISNLMDINDL